MSDDLTLGVLDQSPIRQGATAAQALHETVALAQAAERFGYARFWVAEHHNAELFAGTAPEILIGQIAAKTSRIRVGSGGVMLSHYSALKVAEEFRVLAAFYPDRIDLGIGRAPGSDPHTAVALADPKPIGDINQFPRQVADLVGFLHGELPAEHTFARIAAQPGPAPEAGLPEVWLLGSSDYSARLAASMGLPFAFADFFGTAGGYGPLIAEMYREEFRPSRYLAEPRLSVAVHVICAETEERARTIGASMRFAVAQLRTGRRPMLLPPDEAARHVLDTTAEELVAHFTRQYIEGTPEIVRAKLRAAADRYDTRDLAIVTNCYAFEDRVRSFELTAQAMRLTPEPTRADAGARPGML